MKALAGLATAAWLCGFAIAGLTWRCFRDGLATVPVEPITVCVVVMAACTAGALLLAAWRMLAGPSRFASVMWCIASVVPGAVVAGDLRYAQRQWEQRLAPRTYPFVAAQCLAVSAMHVGASRAYRYKLDTDHVRMYYQPDLTEPRRDAELMSAFVTELSARLNVKPEPRLVWLRGGMLGLTGAGFGGVALGSPGPGRVNVADRRAFAAAMLERALGPADPPALLTDGWAFAAATASTRRTARAALTAYGEPPGTRLADLSLGDRYHRHTSDTATIGGGLVLYLRARFGDDTVLELCRKSEARDWPRTFARVIGVPPASFDARFLRWLRTKAGRASP